MKNILQLIFLIGFLTAFSSCIVKKPTKEVLIFDEDTTKIKVDTITTDTISEFTIEDTIIDIEKPLLKLKDEYNITIILPLYSDSVQLNWEVHSKEDLKDFNFPKKAIESISFIEGMILALKENQDTLSKLNIYIYDNEASYLKTKELLLKLKNKEIDFIIGPMLSKNITLVSSFSKENDIIMVSPFSHSQKLGNDYEKYIMPRPTLSTHLSALTLYIKDSIENSSLKILYPNTSMGEKYADVMRIILNNFNDTILKEENKITYSFISVEEKTNDRKNFKIVDFLDENYMNSIIILPAKSGFIHSMLTLLNGQLKNYDITVFGMPNWKNSNTSRLDYFNNLNVHYSDIKWVDKREERTKIFIENYKEEYKIDPSEIAMYSYDLFKFFSINIHKYGLSIAENIQNEDYKGIYTNFSFRKSYVNSLGNNLKPFSPLMIENNALHIISYKKFKLQLEK